MDQLIHSIIEWAGRQGVGVAMLMVCIWVLYKKQQKDAVAIKEAWDSRNISEANRFSEMQQRLNASDIRHESCEKHRIELGAQLFQLALITGREDMLLEKKIDENKR